MRTKVVYQINKNLLKIYLQNIITMSGNINFLECFLIFSQKCVGSFRMKIKKCNTKKGGCLTSVANINRLQNVVNINLRQKKI